MTETLVGVSSPSSRNPADPPSAKELAAAKELVRLDLRSRGCVVGSGRVVKALNKTVIETALGGRRASGL
jgi:hypothetical protein